VSVLLNDGTGTFSAAVDYVGAGSSVALPPEDSLAIADLNGDGRPDVVLVDRVSVLLNTCLPAW
jgi:hypothetical protein